MNNNVIDEIALGIILIRGQKVILDKTLAQLYGVKPIRLREQVKRNRTRFPDDFMFQLSAKEVNWMVSQNAIPSKSVLGGALPYAFTEHGALMLASVLNSRKAVKMSIYIVRAFIKLRGIVAEYRLLLSKIGKLEGKYDQKFRVVFDALRALIRPPEKKVGSIGFRPK